MPTRINAESSVSEAFLLPKKTFSQQYANVYFGRLAQLRNSVNSTATERWSHLDGVTKADRVLGVKQGQLCWIVGTVYCDMPLKPSVLEDLAKEQTVSMPPPQEKYTSPGSDTLVIEDESGRIRLTGSVAMDAFLVTGVVCAVLGSETVAGEFHVVDICFAGYPDQPGLDTTMANSIASKSDDLRVNTSKQILIVSGLGITGDATDDLSLSLLSEYLNGELGRSEPLSRVCKVIIAGNSLHIKPLEESSGATARNRTKKYGYDASTYNPKPTMTLDAFLESVVATIPVDIMPGPLDPAGITVPQQPLHASLTPVAHMFQGSTLTMTTNPARWNVDGVHLLGTAGQNIDDIYKYVEDDDRLAMMKRTLEWRHIAPTAPDTLLCYPFPDKDPFVLDTLPHVYFIGNQTEFDTTLVHGTRGQVCRIIRVPTFKDTRQAVLVDLHSLEARVLQFDNSFMTA